MRARCGAAAVSLLLMLVLAAGVQAAITGSTITSPADGALLFQNYGTDPAQMLTVTGTVDGVSGNVFRHRLLPRQHPDRRV